MNNRQAEMYEVGKIRIADCEMPEAGPGEVLIKVECCGVCGSDVHFFRYGRIGEKIAPVPFVLGHEISGTVIKTGENVTALKIGDRVAVEPGTPCGSCEMCRKGRYNLCENMSFLAAPPTNGNGCDVVIEAAGVAATMSQTWKYVRKGGVIVVSGNVTEPVSYDFMALMRKEADIRTIWRYKNLYPSLIDAVSSGKINLDGIVTQRFPFDEAEAAFNFSIEHAENIIKVMINF